jgi:hypothetical protein
MQEGQRVERTVHVGIITFPHSVIDLVSESYPYLHEHKDIALDDLNEQMDVSIGCIS